MHLISQSQKFHSEKNYVKVCFCKSSITISIYFYRCNNLTKYQQMKSLKNAVMKY